MLIEIKFVGEGESKGKHIIQVRKASSRNDRVKLWADLQKGQVDSDTGMSFEELREKGEGYHELEE